MKELFKLYPWLAPEFESPPPKFVPLEVTRASGGWLTDLTLLRGCGVDTLYSDYAKGVSYALQYGTSEDLEILSQWGRENLPEV